MPVSTSENLKLEEGEMICDKCEGKGCISSKIDPTTMASSCQKCQGTGKVDWIENIVGKKPEMQFGSSSTSSMSSGGTFAVSPGMNNFLDKEALDVMSKHLAAEIDKEILESLMVDLEQTNKKMKKAANVFADMGGTVFDNRIISKFMLFFATKPEVKNQENESLISRCSRHPGVQRHSRIIRDTPTS